MNNLICLFWSLLVKYHDSGYSCQHVGHVLSSIRINKPEFKDTFEQELLNHIEESKHNHVECSCSCDDCWELFGKVQIEVR